ncbi:MAG: CHASE2 domain-containing protein, partial [Treponema sp.]|nr:CHASE2 domain-containing protein [Treponema sp.]
MTTNRKVPAAVIALLVFIVLGALHIFDVFDYLEYKAYDFRVKLFADTYKPSDDIVVILLDQHSIDWANQEKGWGWPWPRMAYADIVNFMNAGGAKSVAFDVLFTEPSIYRSANQDEIIDTAVQRMEELRQRFTGAGAGENPPGRRDGGTGLRSGGTGVRGEGRDDGPGEEQRRLFENYASAMTALRGLSDRADDNALVKAAEEYGRVVMTVFFSTQTGNAAAWPA